MRLSRFSRVVIYGLLALMSSAFPLLFLVLPVLGCILVFGRRPVEHTSAHFKPFVLIHLAFWMGSCALLKEGGLIHMMGMFGHGVVLVFYSCYMLDVNERFSSVLSFSLFVGCCSVLVWICVGADYWVLGQQMYQEMFRVLQEQSEHLRQALFKSQISPYQLPAHIRLLLEKGAAEWTRSVMLQIPYGLLGAGVIFGFLNWLYIDYRLSRLLLCFKYRLPDWTMILTVVCLGLWIACRQMSLDSTYLIAAEAVLCTGFWLYAGEGFSILMRLKVPIRRFWIIFFMLAALFFYGTGTWVVLVVTGILAQVYRFLPYQKRSQS